MAGVSSSSRAAALLVLLTLLVAYFFLSTQPTQSTYTPPSALFPPPSASLRASSTFQPHTIQDPAGVDGELRGWLSQIHAHIQPNPTSLNTQPQSYAPASRMDTYSSTLSRATVSESSSPSQSMPLQNTVTGLVSSVLSHDTAMDHSGSSLPSSASETVLTFEFAKSPGSYLSIGHDFVTAKGETCWAFAARGRAAESPAVAFKVEKQGSNAIALKSLSSGNYLRAIAPGKKGPTWVVMADAPSSDSPATHFTLNPMPTNPGKPVQSHLFSVAAKGHVNLPTNSDDIRCHGSPSKGLQKQGAQQTRDSLLNVRLLTDREVEKSLHFLSESVRRLKVTEEFIASHRQSTMVTSGVIAIATAITSKGTQMNKVEESPYFRTLLPSILSTWEGGNSGFEYRFYVGFDAGDRIYDSEDSKRRFRSTFNSMVGAGKKVSLHLLAFPDTAGAPSWAVANLMQAAYNDGAEWLYQLNDDARLHSKGWERILTSTLANNPLHPFLGSTGPIDGTNQRIFTHAFTHRLHIDIHGRFFPKAFKNYYSDDWISSVYGPHSTFKIPTVTMKHETKSQKTGKIERYQPDHSAKNALGREVEEGAKRVARFLAEKHGTEAGVVPAHTMCGYAALVEYV